MIVEVVAVGTELLIGDIVNTNAAAIGKALAEEGFDAHYQVTVGDNLGRLEETIRLAASRSDAVILSGGIGPTQDDLTREALARVAGADLVRDESHAATITKRLRALRPDLPENNLRQADYPEGGEPLPNLNGMALGIALQHEGTMLFAIPGVPSEMRAMLHNEVLPRLRRMAGGPAVLSSRTLRTWGLGESQVSALLDDLFASTNPSIAFLVDDMEVKVRITAKAPEPAAAEEAIAPVEEEVRRRLGQAVFTTGSEAIEEILALLLSERGWTLATREAATIGLVGARFAAGRGASCFRGSVTSLDEEWPPGPPHSDVLITVGTPSMVGDGEARRVRFEVTTPEGGASRHLNFVGDGERMRTFATLAALHLGRLAVSGAWWEEE